jgi:hypothetical protein
MPTFRVTRLDGRTEQVEGDDTGVEGSGAVVIYRDVLVMSRPRRIVARRFTAADGVCAVDLVDEGPEGAR